MLVSLKKFVGAAAVASLFTVSLLRPGPGAGSSPGARAGAGSARAGARAQKNWKDRAEYDLYEAITKEATPAKRLELLNQWNEKYPTTEFKLERQLLYLDTYQKLGQAPKILESANNIIAIDPTEPYGAVLDGVSDDVPEQHHSGRARRGRKGGKGVVGRPGHAIRSRKSRPTTRTSSGRRPGPTWRRSLQDARLGAMMRKNGAAAQENFDEELWS